MYTPRPACIAAAAALLWASDHIVWLKTAEQLNAG
jgi:hypothetical protein